MAGWLVAWCTNVVLSGQLAYCVSMGLTRPVGRVYQDGAKLNSLVTAWVLLKVDTVRLD